MHLSIASDHAGFERKQQILNWLEKEGHTLTDFGTHSEESVDYPDFVHPLVRHLEENPYELGILICGSGEGVCMTANKYAHIRAALVWKPEIASLTRQHNNANVICLPGRFLTEAEAIECVRIFLSTEFEGGRHQKRIDKMKPTI
jgi:ribose 5-phosphate isomerase B